MPTYLMKNLINAQVENEMNSDEYREILFNIQVLMTFANDMKYIIMRNRHSEPDINDYPEYKPAPQPEYLRDICLSLSEIFFHFGKLDLLADEMSKILTLTPEGDHDMIVELRKQVDNKENLLKTLRTDHQDFRNYALMTLGKLRDEIGLMRNAGNPGPVTQAFWDLLRLKLDDWTEELTNHYSDVPF